MKGDRERSYWNQINFSFMSLELSTDDEDGTAYKVHTPIWRSQGMITFLVPQSFPSYSIDSFYQ